MLRSRQLPQPNAEVEYDRGEAWSVLATHIRVGNPACDVDHHNSGMAISTNLFIYFGVDCFHVCLKMAWVDRRANKLYEAPLFRNNCRYRLAETTN
jgi:hypothetical protein